MSSARTVVTDPNGIEWMWVTHYCPSCNNAYPRNGKCSTCKAKAKLIPFKSPKWVNCGPDPWFDGPAVGSSHRQPKGAQKK